jgi:hypothetical protein
MRRLPAVNLSLKLGVLAVALVPPAGLVLASTPLEETLPINERLLENKTER